MSYPRGIVLAVEDLRQHLGADDAALIMSLSQWSVRLRRGGPVEPDSADSRLGGRALLPPGVEWPVRGKQPLSFLGQVRLDEVAWFGHDVPLAAGDLLAFFYDVEDQPWGFDPGDAAGWRVLQVDPASAVALEPPAGAQAFPPFGLTLAAEKTVPSVAEPEVANLFVEEEQGVLADLEAESQARDGFEPFHRMFGWPEVIQNAMRSQCQLASQGISADAPLAHPGAEEEDEELGAGARDWKLLLQIDSDDDAEMMWGDSGRLYYWIREDDLRDGRFDKVWLVLQCY